MFANVQDFINDWLASGEVAMIVAERKNDQNARSVRPGEVPASAGDLFVVNLVRGKAAREAAIANNSDEPMGAEKVRQIDTAHNNIRGWDTTGYNYKNPTEPGCFACVGVDFIRHVVYRDIAYNVAANGDFSTN